MIKVDKGVTGAGVICQGISEEVMFEGDLNGERETAVKIGGCSRWRGQHVQRPWGRTGPGVLGRLSQVAFEPSQAGDLTQVLVGALWWILWGAKAGAGGPGYRGLRWSRRT